MSDYRTDGRSTLVGSKSLDFFRRIHKDEDKTLWSSDLDFIWIEKNPYRIIAALELKNRKTDSGATFAESVVFNVLLELGITVLAVVFSHDDSKIFNIDVYRVNRVNPKPNPPSWGGEKILSNGTWDNFIELEKKMRLTP